MLKSEFKYLKKNKFFILAISVLTLVPMIYAVPFLGSLLDPYGKLDNLPVAVINKDEPYTFHKQKLTVGADVVDNLKESKQLDFKFPSEEKAKQGLEDGEYYMVVTIPKNFSKNATTILDDKPKKMIVDYETSSGHSFIAGKLSDSAASKLTGSVSEQVSQAYSKTMIKQVKNAGKGIKQASDGSHQLADGVEKLADGNEKITTNLNTLADKTLIFQNGANQYAVGIGQYVNGVDQLANGSQQLQGGLAQMQSQMPTLSAGVQKLQTGQNQLASGLTQYTDGVHQAAVGAQKLADAVGQVGHGSTELQAVQQSVESLAQDFQQQQGASKIAEAEAAVGKIKQAEANLRARHAGQTNGAIDRIREAGKKAGLTAEQIQKLVQAVQEQAPDSSIAQDLQDITVMKQSAEQLLAEAKQAEAFKQRHQQDLKTLQGQLPGLKQQAEGIKGKVAELQAGTRQLSNGLNQLDANSPKLLSGANQLAGGTNQLAGKLPTLVSGVSQLSDGSTKLTQGFGQLTANNGKLMDGADQLANGSGQISDGSAKLAEGSALIGPGLQKVHDGNAKLADQLGNASDQVKQLPANRHVYEQMANPAEVRHTELDVVGNNGTGMAPYMFSVGLFVAMMGLNLTLNLLTPRTPVKSVFRWFASKVAILFSIATVMALILFGASQTFLGMEFVEPQQTLGLLILIAWMDAALVTAIYLWAGKAGAFVSMLLLVAQLSLSAGTYPIELSGQAYQMGHAFVPMTYTVEALRKTMMIGTSPSEQVTVIVAILVGALILMGLYFVKKKKTFDDLTEDELQGLGKDH